MREINKLFLIIVIFLGFYFFPLELLQFKGPFFEAIALAKWYAREHVILCLVPAFFIAGAITNFIKQESVIKYLGFKANKIIAYGVASISGTILAVCSCTVLPLFAGIYKKGAGLGPASAFLYSGPAINILAIILTARVLGMELGVARAVGSVIFSIIIGLLMHFIFLKEEKSRQLNDDIESIQNDNIKDKRGLIKTMLYFAVLIAILVFANWGKDESMRIWTIIYQLKWIITGVFIFLLIIMLFRWFNKDELKEWTASSWSFSKQIFPLLLGGVIVAGFLLGRPGYEGIIPSKWVSNLVGGNSLWANLFASVVGSFMYFATLTEIPILQGLMGSGMGKGPALSLLLAGPALSLPSMVVIRSILGTKKAVVYILLVIIMATITGMIFGTLF